MCILRYNYNNKNLNVSWDPSHLAIVNIKYNPWNCISIQSSGIFLFKFEFFNINRKDVLYEKRKQIKN